MDNQNKMCKILVAYASKAGSTGEVAQAIGQTLSAGDAAVDVRLAGDVTDVSDYDAVVVGSAIRMGRWLPEATNLVKENAAAFGELPIAYFAVSGFLKDPEKRGEVEGYLAPVRAMREPDSIGLFAGKMDYSKLSFFERMIVKMVGTGEGDWRDWDAIHTWAKSLRPMMTNT